MARADLTADLTWLVRGADDEGVAAHGGQHVLPGGVDGREVTRLSRHLLPDVVRQEDVLWQRREEGQ